MDRLSDEKIIDSWRKNVTPWISAVQDHQIESRKLITDQAIIDSIMELGGSTILDIGCGEGWLARKLSSLGFNFFVFGVDVIPELIDEAKKNSNAEYQVLAYDNISNKTITSKFDIAVCNFSLLGKESVESLFKVIPTLLNNGGHFIIQTPHPIISCGELKYKDGWREGSWAGFSSEFSDPAPWYFRTIESWTTLFIENRFKINQLKEPVFQDTKKAASLIISGCIS